MTQMMWIMLQTQATWQLHHQLVVLGMIHQRKMLRVLRMTSLILWGLDLPSRQWTTESYSHARLVNQLNEPSDTNILYFSTMVQQDAYFGHLVKKLSSSIKP